MVILFSLNAKYNLESSAGATTRHQLICVFMLFESLKESCGLTDGINYFLGIFLPRETILEAGFRPNLAP